MNACVMVKSVLDVLATLPVLQYRIEARKLDADGDDRTTLNVFCDHFTVIEAYIKRSS